jgi:hypothetical protein
MPLNMPPHEQLPIHPPERHASWRYRLNTAFAEHADSWSFVEESTISPDELDVPFQANSDPLDQPNGRPFAIWTRRRIYFSTDWDTVASVSRSPDGKLPHYAARV